MPLTKAILDKNIAAVRREIPGARLNEFDRYGCTPLVHAAIVTNNEIIKLLLKAGADPNVADHMSCTPLYWAVDGDDIECAKTLLEAGANPNAYNSSGQPILLYPIIRDNHELVQLLVQHGAVMDFAQDYIETKRLAHVYELVGKADVIDPNGVFVEVDTEGFYLEFSLKQVMRSLKEYMEHRDAQAMQHHFPAIEAIMPAIEFANELRYYKHRLADKGQGRALFDKMPDLALLPFTYEGHAATAATFGPYFLFCDRGESKVFKDNITIYKYSPENFTTELKSKLFLDVFSRKFIEHELPLRLKFQRKGSINIPGQIAGNCSWANVEASVLSLLTLHYTIEDKSLESARVKAYEFYTHWLEWLKDWTLGFVIADFKTAGPAKKAAIANLLGLIMFQALKASSERDLVRANKILPIISTGPYQYIMQSYAKAALPANMRHLRKDAVATLKACNINLSDYLE